MKSLSLKTLVQLVCTFASLCEGSIKVQEAGPVPVLWGLFCYYLLCFKGLFSVPVVCLFCFTPSCTCNSAGITKLEMVRNPDIVVTTVKGQFIGPKALYRALLL